MCEREQWLVPDYYDGFTCKGGACRQSCCMGWNISVSRTEYFRLIGMDCAPELHRKLECALHLEDTPTPERYAMITPDWQGDCPLHAADGLCDLQRALGAQALPSICRLYPRSMKADGTRLELSCSNSCEAVIERLMCRREPLRFHFETLEARAALRAQADPRLPELGRQCLNLLQNRAHALPERLKAIDRLVKGFAETGKIEAAPFTGAVAQGAPGGAGAADPLDELMPARGALTSGTLARMMEALRLSFDFSPALRTFGADALERYGAQPGAALENLLGDLQAFDERFPDWERIFENILSNHLLYADFPYVDARVPIARAGIGLCAIYLLMRVLCAAYVRTRPTPDALADALAGIFRTVEHAPFYYNALVLLGR